jgi:hypothetical protein
LGFTWRGAILQTKLGKEPAGGEFPRLLFTVRESLSQGVLASQVDARNPHGDLGPPQDLRCWATRPARMQNAREEVADQPTKRLVLAFLQTFQFPQNRGINVERCSWHGIPNNGFLNIGYQVRVMQER